MKTFMKTALLAVFVSMLVVLTACSAGDADQYPDLGRVGLDELVTMTVPEGYDDKSGEGGGTFLPKCYEETDWIVPPHVK